MKPSFWRATIDAMNTRHSSRLVKIFFLCSGILGALLFLAQRSRSRMDDPDPAKQREMVLLPPTQRAPNLAHITTKGRPVAVFFARTVDGQMLFHDLALQADLDHLADLVLVTGDRSRPTVTRRIAAILPDPKGDIAKRFAMTVPRDGGYPTGYVLIDRGGFIRYRTLDPHCIGMGQNEEITALLKALQ